MSEALVAGIAAGLAVAVPLGAIGVLIVDLGIRGGFRPAFLAGLGTATADGLYAVVAAAAGAAVAALLSPAQHTIRLVAAGILAAVAIVGLLALRRPVEDRPPPPADHRLVLRFVALTAVNPTTAATFAGLMIGLPAVDQAGADARVLFVAGVFAASLAWQSTLAAGGALLGHRLSARARTITTIVGQLLVLALAFRLATS